MLKPRTTTIALAGALALAATIPSAAGASSVRRVALGDHQQVQYAASAGLDNDVKITQPSGKVVVHDSHHLGVGVGCARVDAFTVSCSSADVKRIRVRPGDGVNAVLAEVMIPTEMKPSEGNPLSQYYTGGSARDQLYGGTGGDVLTGRGGLDDLMGGDGGDRLEAGPRANHLLGQGGDDELIAGPDGGELLSGGPGLDKAIYDRWTDQAISIDGRANDGNTLDGGERDNVIVERVWTGKGNDHITGDSGPNLFYGGQGDDVIDGAGGDDHIDGEMGNDVLEGGPGADALYGGFGNDKLLSYDAAGDDSDICGPDSDTVQSDAGDLVGYDCETSLGRRVR
jgi:Ca2+-binding RTX toxin-like protein